AEVASDARAGVFVSEDSRHIHKPDRYEAGVTKPKEGGRRIFRLARIAGRSGGLRQAKRLGSRERIGRQNGGGAGHFSQFLRVRQREARLLLIRGRTGGGAIQKFLLRLQSQPKLFNLLLLGRELRLELRDVRGTVSILGGLRRTRI